MSQKNEVVVDAKGDILVGKENNLTARLGVGEDGAVLTADSSAQLGVAWSNGTSAPLVLTSTGSAADPALQINNASTTDYGIEIYNSDGANRALVVHQYSAASAAVQIDNTDNQPAIYVQNTDNETLNPGGVGSGDVLYFADHGTARCRITGHGTLLLVPTAGAPFQTLDVVGNASSTRACAVFRQNGGGTGVIVIQGAGGDSFYPFQIQGRTRAAEFYTTQDGANSVVVVDKKGTGAGVGLTVTNRGTGLSVDIRSASASLFAVTAAGLPQWVAAGNQQTTVGAAGAASALPATPTKYLQVVDSAGTTLVVPAYAAA